MFCKQCLIGEEMINGYLKNQEKEEQKEGGQLQGFDSS